MVTLTFNLDYDKMKRDGISESDMLEPMRKYSSQYGVSETDKGVFSAEGENALCIMMKYVMEKARKSTDYIIYLKSWILDTGTEVEDCKTEMIKLYKKKGIIYNE